MVGFQILDLAEKKFVGKSLEMSFLENRTSELWREFVPKIKNIEGRFGGERISLQMYSDDFMNNPSHRFTKWALVEVSDFDSVPEELENITITGGLYAVFPYKGNVIQAPAFFERIFKVIIPVSDYELDNSRPHFEILPEGKYDPMNPDSEETIYIPIRLKK